MKTAISRIEKPSKPAVKARTNAPQKTATALLIATKESITGPPNMGLFRSDSEGLGFADAEFSIRQAGRREFSAPLSRP